MPLVSAMLLVTLQTGAQAAPATINDSSNLTINGILIENITFNGLQRLTEDSLFILLPVTVGDTINEQTLAQSIENLYATGSFDNIQAYVDGNDLIFNVVERPIIAEINFEGNKLIPDESLTKGLDSAGLGVGDVLKQSTLQGVTNEIQQQYISQGYYNSDIQVDQTLLEGNRAVLTISFVEGSAAKVVDVNVIGNEYFSDEQIKDVFALKESSWTNLLSKSDRYAKEKFAASLESLKALYTNEGFINFHIDDAVLNISEDKKNIFIEVSLTEGDQYKFGEVNFLGEPTFSAETLKQDVAFKSGERYSQNKLDETTAALSRRYGNAGFYLAQFRSVTRIDEDTRTVNIDYYIDPARPIYVRRINFSGNFKTADEVLRREMRQLEGALASNEKIQRSRARLLRTGYFANVEVEIVPVPELPDQIDVNFIVEEQPSGTSTIAAGYSQSGGVTFQIELSQLNFLGTGNKVNTAFLRSETYDSYSIGYTDPYFTTNGVSQGISGYYKKTKYDDNNVNNYVSDSYGATLNYGYPIDERQRINMGFNYDNTEIRGGRLMSISSIQQLLDDGGKTRDFKVGNDTLTTFKNDYNTYNLLLGWDYSTLDRPVFPTTGMSHSVNATVGFGDKNFQKMVYRGNIYHPVYNNWISRIYAKLGYGNELPFYENFYAGGYGSVRGYESSTLGPTSPSFYDTQVNADYIDDEVGGNALVTFGTELILPLPFKGDWADQIRPVLFVEGGQVFDTTDQENTNFVFQGQDTGFPLISQDKEFRYSAGAGMTWYTPIGPISLSYAVPFNDKSGDQVEEVQFQIGSTF